MPDRAPHDVPPPAAPRHRTSTNERGSFCLARCDCGWRGPARRARSQARTDAERHLADVAAADG
ncbi:hypothetical protein [Streptomyces sp. NPDC093589]|uniref:hypothetical protein n=1 Tax=Streptomyces sp. NPDC093589 TaxID=3366043 RepID=UPI0038014E38